MTYDPLKLENAVSETKALLKVIGEAYQNVVETDHNDGSSAAGLQTLRWNTVARLEEHVESARLHILDLESKLSAVSGPSRKRAKVAKLVA